MCFVRMATSLVTLHVAANAKRFATSRVWALEGLFSRVRVAVDAKAAWSAKCLVTCRADIAVLRWGVVAIL